MHTICDLPTSELDKLCAQPGTRPVPATPPMDPDWKARLAERHEVAAPQLQSFRRTMLERFGGGDVNIWMGRTEDVAPLLERGQLWIPSPQEIDYLEGEPTHCHDNVCEFWKEQPDRYVLATGYGLSQDGLWRPHSWLMEPQNDGPARIVETTVGRLAYFGYVMDLPQSIDFVFGGTPAHLREQVLQMLRKPAAAALEP